MNNQPSYDFENTNYHPQGFAPPRLPRNNSVPNNNRPPVYQNTLSADMLPQELRPLGAWAYFGYGLLFGIPIVGIIFAIVFACGGAKNINLRNYARSFFCSMLVSFILIIILNVIMIALWSAGGIQLADAFSGMI